MRRSGLCVVVAALLFLGVVGGAATAVATETGTVAQEQLLKEIEELKARVDELQAVVDALSRELVRLRAEVLPQPGAEQNGDVAGSDSSSAEATEEQSMSQWKTIKHGWQYRNASLADDRSGNVKFIVEVGRTGSEVKVATLTVTLYDSSERIIATGTAVVLNMLPGDVRTVEFVLEGDAAEAAAFRLQIDSEVQA